MKIIRKRTGYLPEILDLDRDKIQEIFDSGMDKTKLANSIYLISKYPTEKSEKTFNTSIIFPHTNIVQYYNDIYIIKKTMRFRDLPQVEIDDLLKLFKYPDNLKDPLEKKEAKKKEEIIEESKEEVIISKNDTLNSNEIKQENI